ncbi:MAG: DUF3048 domain-containing protein [Eubacterium sp.]
MPDSEELDKILKEIKNMGNKEEKDEKPQPQKKLNREEANRVVEQFNTPSLSHKEPIENKKPKKEPPMKKNNKKIIIIAIVAVLVVAIIAAVAVFASKGKNKENETTQPSTSQTTAEVTEAPVNKANPLTGESDFAESAVGKRPIACVVENSAAARPQWGIDDSKNPPDIIVEGEVEGGETRMLWMYADYTAVPSQIGPMRSARPPYIKFSELFDAIFLHWGQSQTKKGTAYIGANTVFRVDEVDHINQMTYTGSVALFGRDSSRDVSSEHTGVLYGDKIEDALKEEGFRLTADEKSYTKFGFNEEDKEVGNTACNSLALTFSSRTSTRDWTYNSDDKMYHCSDYNTDVTRKNLLILFDETEYITKENYKNSGSAEIYCNYKLSGGKGKLASDGTVADITWSVENGLLVIKGSDGKEINLNVGTTWIGYASSNNGGAVSAE